MGGRGLAEGTEGRMAEEESGLSTEPSLTSVREGLSALADELWNEALASHDLAVWTLHANVAKRIDKLAGDLNLVHSRQQQLDLES